MEFVKSEKEDGAELAEIRAIAMKPSLLKIGRYDPDGVRNRFLERFEPSNTYKITSSETLVGFFAVSEKQDHHYLDHLYIKPEYQNSGVGKSVLNHVIGMALAKELPLRLGALRESRSNDFYSKNGFVKTHEDEFDIYYEYPVHN